MKTTQYLLIVIALYLVGCAENDIPKFCNVSSIADLEWLNTELETNGYTGPSGIMDVFVYKALYQNEEVIFISTCCPACNTLPPIVKKCNGEQLGYLGVEIDEDSVTSRKVIWRTRNGVCS